MRDVHDVAVELVGACACACHRGVEACWCRPDPRGHYWHEPELTLSHTTWVELLGSCPSPTHHAGGWCARPDDPVVGGALRRWEDEQREARLRRGRPTGSDLSWLARHPGHPLADPYLRR